MKPWQRSFTAEGLNMERLIRQAAEQGIMIRALRRHGRKRISGCVAEEDLPAVEMLAQQGGWYLEPGRRMGAGRWLDRLHSRWITAAASLTALIVLAGSTQLIWQVEILQGGVYEADIRAYLTELGIRPLQWKGDIDTGELRDQLEWRYPDVAWIECGWRGMKLCITVEQGVAQGEAADWRGSKDVVASRDGIVDHVITLAGTPQVKRGDLVRRGDILIAGEERTSDGAVRPVSARGKVLARVWDGAEVRMSTAEAETVYSGRQHETYTAALPYFDLWATDESGFESQDLSVRTLPLGGLFLPFTYRCETRYEVQTTLQRRDEDELRSEAGLAALKKLNLSLKNGDEFLTKWVEYSMIDDEVLCARAIGERVIDIGQAWPRGNGQP